MCYLYVCCSGSYYFSFTWCEASGNQVSHAYSNSDPMEELDIFNDYVKFRNLHVGFYIGKCDNDGFFGNPHILNVLSVTAL